MNLVGLDLGTSAGAAWFDGTYRATTWELLEQSEKRWCSPALRFIRYREELLRLLEEQRPDLVVYEKVLRHSSVYASHVYGGLLATLQTTLEDRGIPFEGVGVGEAKQALTGHGGASKDRMLARAAELGVDCPTDDAADALGILLAGEQRHGIVRLPEAARPESIRGPSKRTVRSPRRQRDRDW